MDKPASYYMEWYTAMGSVYVIFYMVLLVYLLYEYFYKRILPHLRDGNSFHALMCSLLILCAVSMVITGLIEVLVSWDEFSLCYKN